MIQVLGDYILHINVKEAKYFSVTADEVTDTSNEEQLAVVLRYVNPSDHCIREFEDLVCFLECSGGITGQALAEMLLDFLTKHGIDPTNLCGQAYNDAGKDQWHCCMYHVFIFPCSLGSYSNTLPPTT